MLRPKPRMVSSALRAAGYLSLLVLIALTLTVEGSQPAHTHASSTAGLYDSECPLAELAAFHGASPLPESPPAVSVALADSAPAARSSEQSPASPAQHTDSRAPPSPLV